MTNMIWQVIDTAPTDGTAILMWPYRYYSIWQGRGDMEVVLGYFDEHREEWFNPETGVWFEPSHWMPLPNPPENNND